MKRSLLACLLITLIAPLASAEPAGLRDGDRVAIVGDSITEQKLYSVFIEDYLLMCKPQADLRGTVEYKKHLAGILVARGLRQAFARLGVEA